jgi:hypothetical protein
MGSEPATLKVWEKDVETTSRKKIENGVMISKILVFFISSS